MAHAQRDATEKFENTIGINFQLYNSLFLSLPFHGIEKTGTLLTLFNQTCEAGYDTGKSPSQIIDDFFLTNTSLKTEKEKLDLLFRFVQYAERQVVLFDALEDATFNRLHDRYGPGSIKHLTNSVSESGKSAALAAKAKDFCVRLVLTAHPTQFYPDSVLGIINDLAAAINENDATEIKVLLQQLGRTPFLKKEKPTPFDEAESLIWYLENVFYTAIGKIISALRNSFPDENLQTDNLIKMGFWSGGDRDGNPFVSVNTTVKVADALRTAILRSYHQDVRKIGNRLTFSGVDKKLATLKEMLYRDAYGNPEDVTFTKELLLDALNEIQNEILEKHDGLFINLVDDLILKVQLFGLHFASLDIRQDSSVHENIYSQVSQLSGALGDKFKSFSDNEKIDAVLGITETVDADMFPDELTKDTFANIKAIRRIQEKSGEHACNRYIISHSQTALDVIEVFGLFLLCGWNRDDLTVDIVPLFETVEDLKNAANVMRELYENDTYRNHLKRRNDSQTVMLGFSDGTKDGGYLMANYGIYRAKKALTAVSREFGIKVVFFDGRGGPPARGGGKTHKFYSSMGADISDRAIELTVQGQTVSSNFGTVDAASYNIEQLLSAGLYSAVVARPESTFTLDEEKLLLILADHSFASYSELKSDPVFLDYLENITPLNFFSKTNIGSRPSKRGGADAALSLDRLRAIPFVGAWSQIKQNVPGFYGVGTAMAHAESEGLLADVTTLYQNNAFFKALIDNCEMAMQKTFLPLTRNLKEDPVYGDIWKKIRDEFHLAQKYLRIVTGRDDFMTDFPVAKESVKMREKIVLPLTTIQQDALTRLRNGDVDSREHYEKLIVRCSFGIINAGRNSA